MKNGKAKSAKKPTPDLNSRSLSSASKRTTKKDQLIRLLRSKRGMEIATISTKLGWQNHTTRAALTRLRQAGFELEVLKGQGSGPTRYRIVSEPPIERLTVCGSASDA